MYDETEIVKITWGTYCKEYYESLGYEYTGIGTELNVLAKDLPDNSSKHISVICDCCGNVIRTPKRNYISKIKKDGIYRCKACAVKHGVKMIRNEEPKHRIFSKFLEFCEENNYTPLTTIDEYPGIKGKVEFICPIHGFQKLTLNSIINGDAHCYWCGKEKMKEKNRLSKDKVKQIVESKNNNVLLNPEDYIDGLTRNLKIICGSCGQEFTTSLSSIQAGGGRCYSCGEQQSKENTFKYKLDDFLEMLTEYDHEITPNPHSFIDMQTPMEFYCSECGRLFTTTPHNYVKRGFTRCKECSIEFSHGEERIKKYLEEIGILYIPQKTFADCVDKKVLPFDFYIPSLNILIEYDGEQHYRPVDHFGGYEAFIKRQKHDKIKTKYCLEKGIKLIRIPYWDFDNIEDILKNELN